MSENKAQMIAQATIKGLKGGSTPFKKQIDTAPKEKHAKKLQTLASAKSETDRAALLAAIQKGVSLKSVAAKKQEALVEINVQANNTAKNKPVITQKLVQDTKATLKHVTPNQNPKKNTAENSVADKQSTAPLVFSKEDKLDMAKYEKIWENKPYGMAVSTGSNKPIIHPVTKVSFTPKQKDVVKASNAVASKPVPPRASVFNGSNMPEKMAQVRQMARPQQSVSKAGRQAQLTIAMRQQASVRMLGMSFSMRYKIRITSVEISEQTIFEAYLGKAMKMVTNVLALGVNRFMPTVNKVLPGSKQVIEQKLNKLNEQIDKFDNATSQVVSNTPYRIERVAERSITTASISSDMLITNRLVERSVAVASVSSTNKLAECSTSYLSVIGSMGNIFLSSDSSSPASELTESRTVVSTLS